MPASLRRPVMTDPAAQACPCGSSDSYARCCGPLHDGAPAPTAEALMRSRYSAYVLEKPDYLQRSWHVSTRPATLSLEDDTTAGTTWLGLSVKSHTATGAETAEVVFVARFRMGGAPAQRMLERSRFVREGGRWYYLDGDVG
ncbi:MAG: YchJ family metal-binding protein [Pseudoxanthomonas sp.]